MQLKNTIQYSIFNCFLYNSFYSDQDLFVGASSENYLVLYTNRLQDLIVEFPIQEDGVQIQSMAVSRHLKLFFCGTSHGAIRIYNWPLIEESLQYV